MAGYNPGNSRLGLGGTRHHSLNAVVQKPIERSTESQEHHEKVKALIESGTPVLIILRGLPGSGKTTLAKNLLSLQGAKGGSCHSTDNFFLVPRGGKGETEYQYDPLRLGEAHEWNRVQVLRAIAHGVSPIIVDNTNSQKWEMLPYVEMVLEPWRAEKTLRKMAANGSIPKKNICASLGPARMTWKGKKCPCGYTVRETSKVPYQVELLEPLTWWYQNPSRLAKVNQHGVSQKKITQMLSHFEFGVTGKNLVQHILRRKSNPFPSATDQNVRPGGPPGKPLEFMVHLKRNPGSDCGAKLRPLLPRNIPGNNNAFKHNSVNQFQNPTGFSAGPFPQLLGFPSQGTGIRAPTMPLISMVAPSKHNAANTTLLDLSKDRPRNDNFNPLSLNQQSTFSKSASNLSFLVEENESRISSGMECKEKDKGTLPCSLTASENNLFENSSNSETTSFVESECVEMTDEELKEWMETNSSRWEWESSDDDSDDECKSSNEPKPARSLRQKHRDNSSEKTENEERTVGETSVTSARSSDGKPEQETEEIPEWVTGEFDPQISWNPPECTSDNSEELNALVPLPPRNSKRKRLVENPPTSLGDNVESLDNPCNDVDQAQLGIIRQIHTFLGELGVKNKELDSPVQICDDSAGNETNSSNVDNRDVISSTKESSPLVDDKNEELLISFFDPPNSEVVGVVSATETKNTESLENIFNDSCGNDKIDCPLLTAFNVILSKTPADVAKMDGFPPGNTVSTEAVDLNLKEKDGENLASRASTEIKEHNSDSQKHFKYLASVFDEGLKWFDDAFQKRSMDKSYQIQDIENMDKDVRAQFSQQATSCIGVIDSVRESQSSVSQADHFKMSEDLESKTEELLSAELLSKGVDLMEDVDAHSSVKPQLNEKESSTESFIPSTTTLIEFKETVEEDKECITEAQPSNPVQRGKENEISTQLQGMKNDHSKISICLENDLKDSEDEQENVIQFLSTPTKDASLNTEINISKRSPSLENLPEFFNSDANIISQDSSIKETPFERGNVDKNHAEVISYGKIEQMVGSCSNVEVSTIMPLDIHHVNEESATNNLEDKSESEWQSAHGRMLEFIENLKKIRESTTDDLEGTELQSAQGGEGKIVLHDMCVIGEKGSQKSSFSGSAGKENDVCDILAEFEDSHNEGVSKTGSISMAAKEQEENEDFTTDWGALATERVSAMDFDDDKETFPLVLDHNFIEQICQKFGNPYQDSMDESSKFLSVQGNSQTGVTVQVPAYLARKLHECWLKTQWDVILDDEETSQKIVQEDELLARQLQEFEKEDLKEKRDSSSSATPNLREIMDMEMAMAIYKADQDKKTQLNRRSDLSSRLSWDLLTKEFSQIPQDVITQIFSAYNFSYNNTREALLSSLPDYERDLHEGSVKDVVSPEALAAQEKVLIEKAKLESLKFQNTELPEEEDKTEKEVEGSWEALVDQARKSASLNRRLQKERHAQAQAASRSGIPSAAAYYCRMASLHKQKAEEANQKAANILSRVFTGEYNNLKGCTTESDENSRPPTTLDMHSMSVLEALRVVNAFLDAHAEWLRTRKSKPNVEIARRFSQVKMATLFLITGRGVNSHGGIPRIKPAVERQLEKRGVWYEELNPGLLRVMVSASLPPVKKM